MEGSLGGDAPIFHVGEALQDDHGGGNGEEAASRRPVNLHISRRRRYPNKVGSRHNNFDLVGHDVVVVRERTWYRLKLYQYPFGELRCMEDREYVNMTGMIKK